MTTNASRSAWGVDGCKAGWFFFKLTPLLNDATFGVVTRLEQIVEMAGDDDLILVDIPIGLPELVEGRRREADFRPCDKQAREKVGERLRSVFQVPVPDVRTALVEELGPDDWTWHMARKALERRGIDVLPGQGRITQQSLHILRKIDEVDRLLDGSPKAREIVRETHPEVCFRMLGGAPMEHHKRPDDGFNERRTVLNNFWPSAGDAISRALGEHLRREVARDDIVDAIVCALTARIILDHPARAMAFPPRRDVAERSVPPEIVYAIPSGGAQNKDTS